MAFYYKKINESDIDRSIRVSASQMLDFCQKKLGLVRLGIEWIKKAEEAEFNIDANLMEIEKNLKHAIGDYSDTLTVFGKNKDEIWGEFQSGAFKKHMILIRCDIPEREILRTIAHECKHAQDGELYRPAWTKEEKIIWEQRAEAFASDAVREFRSLTGIGG